MINQLHQGTLRRSVEKLTHQAVQDVLRRVDKIILSPQQTKWNTRTIVTIAIIFYHLSNLDTPLPLFHNIACRISCATESLSHCLNPQVVEVHFSSGIQSSDLDLLRQHVKDLVVCIPQVAHNGQQWVLRQLRQKKAKMLQKKRVKLWNLLNFLAWHRKYTRIRSRIKKKSCNMLGRYVKLLCVCTWYCSMCIVYMHMCVYALVNYHGIEILHLQEGLDYCSLWPLHPGWDEQPICHDVRNRNDERKFIPWSIPASQWRVIHPSQLGMLPCKRIKLVSNFEA